jgi:3-oxo-5alpha-steroid 4-dehydrogenase
MSEATMVSEDTGVEPCYQVASADAVSWDEEADLVIVGFGGAGAVAAVQGRERGASVIVVDRFDGGGATAYSGGIFYAGGGTPWQQEAGYADTPEQMQRYLEMERVPVGPETLRRFCEQSADNLAWVSGFGVKFDSTLYSGKITYPPEGKFLYFCGNEKIPHFAAHAKPAPRGHRAVGKGMTGRYYYAAMREAALAAGARLIAHAPARRLIVDPSGAVLGIEIDQLPDSALARHRALYRKVNPYVPMNGARSERAVEQCSAFERNAGAQRLRLRARQGVILATGGFVFNRVQLARYRPDLAKTYKALTRLGSLGCNGSGIGLGQSVGGATDLMDKAFVGRSLSPPEGFVKGMLVNGQGQRFVNEDAYLAIVGNAIATQASSTAWLILDRRTFWAGLKTLLTIERKMFLLYALPTLINILLGGTRTGKSTARLAKKCGIDPQTLEATLHAYNQAARAEAPDAQGKLPYNTAPLADGRLFAIDVSTHNAFGATPTFTLGGLRVEESTGAVQRADGSSVPGLYAAGRCAVGLCSNGYMSGLSIADALFAGRRAATSATTARPAQHRQEPVHG